MFEKYIYSQIERENRKAYSQLKYRILGLLIIVAIQILNNSFNQYTLILLSYIIIFSINEIEKIKIIQIMSNDKK